LLSCEKLEWALSLMGEFEGWGRMHRGSPRSEEYVRRDSRVEIEGVSFRFQSSAVVLVPLSVISPSSEYAREGPYRRMSKPDFAPTTCAKYRWSQS